MSYYRGDYYRGNYRGDIFSSIGNALGSVGRVVGGLVGGPIGSVIQGASGMLTSTPRPPVPAVVAPSFSMSGGPGMALQAPQPRPGGPPVILGGSTVGVSSLGTIGVRSGRGQHPNKSTYYTRNGRVDKGSRMVPNRHMNVGNARALKRALRRAHGFARLARSVMSFTVTGRKHGPGHFKAKRGRR